MKLKNEKDLKNIFKKLKLFELFNNYLSFLINKGKLAEHYCRILFKLKYSDNIHYDLKKNKIRYEVKFRKRRKKDNQYSDILKFVQSKNSPTGFPIPFVYSKPCFDYLLYVFLSSKNKLLAILQYNVKDLEFSEDKSNKKRRRISFGNKKFIVKYLDSNIKNRL